MTTQCRQHTLILSFATSGSFSVPGWNSRPRGVLKTRSRTGPQRALGGLPRTDR